MLKKLGKAVGKMIFSEKKEVVQNVEVVEVYEGVPRRLTLEEDEARYERVHCIGVQCLRMAQIEAYRKGQDTKPFGGSRLLF